MGNKGQVMKRSGPGLVFFGHHLCILFLLLGHESIFSKHPIPIAWPIRVYILWSYHKHFIYFGDPELKYNTHRES
jgi:hypothetical protein